MDREFLENLQLGEETVEAILAESRKELDAHRQEMAELLFNQKLDRAIGEKKGRSQKAIRALLDLEALKNAPDSEIHSALDRLKRECGYLFDCGQGMVYAPGAGSGSFRREVSQEELGRMSMDEYRAYRMGNR